MNKCIRCRIIAEAGVNHNGDVALALRLIDAAADAGADAVKFQTFRSHCLVAAHAPKASYQKKNTDTAENQLNMLRKLELSRCSFIRLAQHAARRGITFLSSPFDLPSIEILTEIGLKIWKIPSGEITNLPYLRKIGALGHSIILSTGMSTLKEVAAALDILEKAGTQRSKITLLHCTTEYPTPFSEVNLRAMVTMQDFFPECAGIGYSDHTKGIEVALAAAALGATVIEKHFTLNQNMEGPDHEASLEPHELAAMIRSIRHIEQSLGDGVKQPTPSEIPNIFVTRKSIVAARSIKRGELFTDCNLTTKRPGNGMSPMLWDTVIDTKAPRDFVEDEAL